MALERQPPSFRFLKLLIFTASIVHVNSFIRSNQITHNIRSKEQLKAQDNAASYSEEKCGPTVRVIYESDNILAINKPPHIAHHNDDTNIGIVTLVRRLQQEGGIEYQGRLYGVHRLDRVTSGILLFAKSSDFAGALSTAFKEKLVTKYYVALTNKKPKKKKQGWVKGDMVPSRRKTWKLVNTFQNPASTRFFTAGLGNCDLTHWKKLHKNQESNESDEMLPKTMILFRPYTGKTHQLRVAAKSLAMPILGDQTYSDTAVAKSMDRTYLHALALHVNVKGEDVTIFDPPTTWWSELRGKSDDDKGLDDILKTLMLKHCENNDILSLMK